VPNNVVVYSVRATFDDPAVRDRYVEWLRNGHCRAMVREGGALSAEVTVWDDGTVEARYLFGTRADFDAYLAGPAEALRADSALLFPPESGIQVDRRLGTRAVRVPD
jgi:hypothetical protein